MNGQPTIEFLGHATFSVRAADGSTLVIDPYPPGALGGALGLPPIDQTFDWGVSTHSHVDHDGVAQLPGPPTKVVAGRAGPFELERHESDHDEYGGRRRGGQVDITIVRVGGVKVVHCSDIGRSPGPRVVDAIAGADALLVPVGGFFTIGAAQAWEWALRCRPKTVIPMHFLSEKGSLPIRGLEPFLTVATWPVIRHPGTYELGRDDDRAKVVVLERKRT